jgi:hypothetical protein
MRRFPITSCRALARMSECGARPAPRLPNIPRFHGKAMTRAVQTVEGHRDSVEMQTR